MWHWAMMETAMKPWFCVQALYDGFWVTINGAITKDGAEEMIRQYRADRYLEDCDYRVVDVSR